ncbi:MAG TPA: lytic transglycosylase domain-containing protein, partial [Bacteroidales bacterium]|nr:lytic transglycosylase domain-containing protein [Bacteroidales bacterium]
QFLKATAIQYGLEVNENVDERYHIEKSTEAACKYLLDAYKIYKSWTLVAASYNMGMGALNKQIAHQNANNYYDLFLNTETARYVYRIISLKLIVKDPKSVGFYIRKKDLYPAIPSFTVEVDSSITNLAKFASGYNINYKILKEFNLWIRKSTFINLAKKKYTITIPNIVNYDSLQLSVSDEPIVLPDTLK